MTVMPRLLFLCVPVLLMTAAGSGFSGPDEAIKTGFTVLIGFPAEETAPQNYVQLGPGVVIPILGSGTGANPEESRQLIEKSLSLAKAAEKLWATFRLDPARKLQEGVQELLLPGKEYELPVLKDVRIRIAALLLKATDSSASYRILFRQDGKILADSTIQVVRGGRAVVGGMDGREAPYVFLLVEPEKSGSTAEKAADPSARAGLTEPRVLEKANPVYPEDCRKERIQGEVVLKVMIQKDGKVNAVSVLQSPDPRLGEAARDAVLKWLFSPARNREGEAVEVLSSITIRFALR